MKRLTKCLAAIMDLPHYLTPLLGVKNGLCVLPPYQCILSL